MIILGVTGSIGMGKSFVTKCFKRLGAKVFDADYYVHSLMRKDGAALAEVEKHFPKVIKKGEVDRDALGKIVYADPKALKLLEDILHNKVRSAELEFIRKSRLQRHKLIVIDIPLLFETGFEKFCDYTIAVTSTKFIQRHRVLGNRKMDEKKFEAIIAKQMPADKKALKADFVIKTGLDKASAIRQVVKIYKKIIAS